MYIVSSFRGGCATVKSNIFFCNRFRIAEAASPEWKVGRGTQRGGVEGGWKIAEGAPLLSS